MRFAIPFLALILPLAGCPTDSCTPNETRCLENRAQICGSDQTWRVAIDCEDLGGETVDWACCWQAGDLDAGVPEGHTCLPGHECPAGGGP